MPLDELAHHARLTRGPLFDRLFAQFGWTITDDFWNRYWNDPWVHNLANAALRLQEENERLRRPVVER